MTGNFNQGRSVGEREGIPEWGAPDQAYSVSGDLSKYVGDIPQSHDRNQPIVGHGTMGSIPGCHGSQLMDGTDVVTSPTNRELMGNSLERMAGNVSMPQFAHAEWVLRGMPGRADYPTSCPHTTGKIKAVNDAFGLGPNVAIPADLGLDPLDTLVDHDYRRAPECLVPGALDKYVGAAGVLAQPVDNANGFTRLHERGMFPTMGTDILDGIVQRSEQIATSYIPPSKPAPPRSNRMLGQSRKGWR